MKRPRPTQDAATTATALRIAHELEEDGDAEAARRCVEYAIDCARELASTPLRFDEKEKHSEPDAPAALVASIVSWWTHRYIMTVGNIMPSPTFPPSCITIDTVW